MASVTPCKRLLAWYDQGRRDLPWRQPIPDPYRTLVSEIMLQQTRVETVLRYYEKFVSRFPTVTSLAKAPEAEVLIHWSGLGYYRRARALHQTAKTIVARGSFPATLDGLKELPGVGDYTAAAVGSIAFGLAVPVVDGNVVRVVSRRLGLRAAGSAAARRQLRAAAAELVDAARPGDSNQAIMELGATVCTPHAPACGICPLRSGCSAAERGHPEGYPAPRRRRETERVRLVAALVVQADGRVLIVRRPASAALLAGTWELPWVRKEKTAAEEAALAARYGGHWSLRDKLGEVRHTITHRALRIELRTAELSVAEGVAEGGEARWVRPSELADLPRSSLLDKLLMLLRCAAA